MKNCIKAYFSGFSVDKISSWKCWSGINTGRYDIIANDIVQICRNEKADIENHHPEMLILTCNTCTNILERYTAPMFFQSNSYKLITSLILFLSVVGGLSRVCPMLNALSPEQAIRKWISNCYSANVSVLVLKSAKQVVIIWPFCGYGEKTSSFYRFA